VSTCDDFAFRARNPLGPDFGDIMGGLVAEPALTRSVRDSAALLDATSGPDVGDPYCAPPPVRPFLQEVGADPGRLRIAFTAEALTGVPVHADCVSAVHDAAALCADLGHEVVEAAPVVDGEWAMLELGRQVSASDYLLAVHALQSVARDVARFFTGYDVWLTPTLGEPPVPLGTFDAPPENPLQALIRVSAFMPFMPIYNATGQPAMSVPLFWNADGLPVGTQFVGRFGDEATLFRLAAQLEQARPWAGRRPPVVVDRSCRRSAGLNPRAERAKPLRG
jgi:amidase